MHVGSQENEKLWVSVTVFQRASDNKQEFALRDDEPKDDRNQARWQQVLKDWEDAEQVQSWGRGTQA
jgi:hypothetical protein